MTNSWVRERKLLYKNYTRIKDYICGPDRVRCNSGAKLESSFEPGLRLRLHPGYMTKQIRK